MRMPWAQRPMRGLPAAREVAVAAEQILIRVVQDPVQLDRILNMIELSVSQHLQGLVQGERTSSGFDPVTGAPSRSAPQYTHRARTAQELRDTAHLVPAVVKPEPAPEPPPAPQPPPRRPNAPERPDPGPVPWL